MFSDDDTFTPTTAQVASLRDFLTLTEDADRPTLRTRKVERHGVTHRDTPAERVKRDSLATKRRNADSGRARWWDVDEGLNCPSHR